MSGKDDAAPTHRNAIYPGAFPSQGGPTVLRAAPTVAPPADGEADMVRQALVSLPSQRQPAGRVIVMADNRTGETVCVARASGAGVIVTEADTCRKSLAVYQAPEQTVSGLADADADAILIQDGGTTLLPRFAAVANAHLSPAAGAAGGVFCGELGGGVLGVFQRSAFARDARDICRADGQVYGPVRDSSAVPLSPFRDKGVAK